jgi:hypothetical protein
LEEPGDQHEATAQTRGGNGQPGQPELAIATFTRIGGEPTHLFTPPPSSIMSVTFESSTMKEDFLGKARLLGSFPEGNPFDHWPEFLGFLKRNFHFLQRLASTSFKHHGKGLLLLQKKRVENGEFEIAYANLEDTDFDLLSDAEQAEFRKYQPPHEFVLCVFDGKGRGYGLRLLSREMVSHF